MQRAMLGVALALLPALARAAPDDLASRIVAEERNLERRTVGVTRFRVSFPQRVSVGIGALVVRQPASYDCRTVCRFRGLLVQAEPGYSGGQLSIGYANLSGEKGRSRHFLTRYFLGHGVRAALLRTWNDADLSPANRTLAGIEGEFSVISINFSLGVFRDVGSGGGDDPRVVTGGMGWGF